MKESFEVLFLFATVEMTVTVSLRILQRVSYTKNKKDDRPVVNDES